jgi:putative heme transporter
VDTGLALWSTTLAALFSAAVRVVLAPLALAFDHLLGLSLARSGSVSALRSA